MIKRVKCLLKLSVLSAALSATALAQQTTPIDQFAVNGPQFLSGKTLEGIYGLADEFSEEIKKVEVKPSGKVMEFHTLHFEGLTLYGFMRNDTDFAPLNIVVTSNRWHLAQDLNVGSAIEKVQNQLGEPTQINENGYVYLTQTGEVVFQYLDGVVTKVTFNYRVE